MKRRTLFELYELAEQARGRSRITAELVTSERIAADRELLESIRRRPWPPLEPELLERAQLVEVDPVTLRSLVDAAAALVEWDALAEGPIEPLDDYVDRVEAVRTAAAIARARFVDEHVEPARPPAPPLEPGPVDPPVPPADRWARRRRRWGRS